VEPLVLTYRDLGIVATHRPVNDVHVRGKKIDGTGAALIGRAEVLVGSFMFDFDSRLCPGCSRFRLKKCGTRFFKGSRTT